MEADSRQRPSPARECEACVICLEPISERAFAVPCDHCAFDFLCLASWLQDQRSCPLCKAQLTAIQYDFRSPTDFKAYKLEPLKSTRAPRRTSTRAPAWPRRTREQETRHRPYMLDRDYAKKRARLLQVGGQEAQYNQSLERRRDIYARNCYSCHVGANAYNRYRTAITPVEFTGDPALQRRARTWLYRELRALDIGVPARAASAPLPSEVMREAEEHSRRPRRWEEHVSNPSGQHGRLASQKGQPSNLEWVLEYIIAVLKTIDVSSSSGKAEELLAEFIEPASTPAHATENRPQRSHGQSDPGSYRHPRTRLFLHELQAWLRSPFMTIEDWDRAVQYSLQSQAVHFEC